MHNFSLVGEVFLYFTLRVEVVKIQISLQIINRFGKRKGIFNIILAMGRNRAGSRAQPNSRFPLPPQRGPAEAGLPTHARSGQRPSSARPTPPPNGADPTR
jgi:hypothetical protein